MGGFELRPGPGKTAPRLLEDLYDYDSRRPRRAGENVLIDSPEIFTGGIARSRILKGDCHHAFFRKDAQSKTPNVDKIPAEGSRYISASYCGRCLHHFDIIADYGCRPERKIPCRPGSKYPLHHLRHVTSETKSDLDVPQGEDKYDAWIEKHIWVCSASDCPVVIEIRITPPRLDREKADILANTERLALRGRRTIESEPARYEGYTSLLPAEVLSLLRAYLTDALLGESKRVAARNKKFKLSFADECDEIFEYLDFAPQYEQKPDGDEGQDKFWALPVVNGPNDQLGRSKTRREFIEDVHIELSQHLSVRPDNEPRTQHSKYIYNPLPAQRDIQKILSIVDYPRLNRVTDLEAPKSQDHPHYGGLGALGDFDNALVLFSYERQCLSDPQNCSYYLECLEGIATGRNSADLQEEVAKAMSLGLHTRKQIEEAYSFLNIDPSKNIPDEYVIGIYENRIESSPLQADEARQCLLIIGEARQSSKIQAKANNREMDLDQALEFLGVDINTDSDSIEAAAVALSFDQDKSKVAAAVRAVGNARNNEYALLRCADNMEAGTHEPTLNIDEAYKRLQVSSHVPDETVLLLYKSLFDDAPSGSKDSFTDALRVIATTRNSDWLRSKIGNPNGPDPVLKGNADQPVGLENIGNTCYLNSLLQYYYTVKSVRDVVMNFDEYRMPLNTETLLNKRVGGRAVDRSEVVKAQKFVEELRGLFTNLKATSSRSVKPTQELAELTLISTATEANFRRASITSPRTLSIPSLINGPSNEEVPPPMPSRPAPQPALGSAPVPSNEEDIEMVDRPSRTSMDKDSDTETLVDFEQSAPNGGPAQTDVSDKENIQQTTATDPKLGQLRLKDGNSVFSIAELSSDGSVVKFEDDTQVSGAALSTPPLTPSDEKRPPVPPRNKPAPISTAGPTEDSLRKERLSFGAQQDVTEVIGNVMFRLQCAIKATSYDAQFGEQIDRIRDTFYGANAVYTKKATGYDSKIEDWANVIVFPSSDGTRSIYEALDVVFDEQVVEIESAMTLQHASISKLPPVLQIQIQRTAFNAATKSASKNENRIVFDETIYLDRYMDSDKVLLRRRDAWKWKNRLKQLEARQKVLEMTTPQLTVPEALGMTKKFLQMLQEDEVPDIQVNGDLPEALEERANELVQELASIAEETENLKKKLQDQFTDMRHHRYRLQAVFIHSGNSSFGHYYIFIYDFARDIWREYNDARVSEVHDTKRIFEHSGFNNPTPYYLVYVRDEDKEGLVDAVCREIPETPLASQTERMDSWPQSSGGLDMERDMENQKYHVENADPSLRGLNGNGGGAWGSTSAQQYNTSGGGAWEQDRDRPPFRGG